MDKYEYNLKIDQMKSLFAEENYEAAAELADTINWNKIKNVNALNAEIIIIIGNVTPTPVSAISPYPSI